MPIVSPSPCKGRNSSAIGTWLRPSFKELVRFRRHDEVVSVHTTDLVCPPGNRYLAPLGQQRRVVALILGLLAYSVGESQCLGEVTEPEHALQAFDAFPLHYLPLGNLREQLCDLCIGQRGFVTAAGGALHLQ